MMKMEKKHVIIMILLIIVSLSISFIFVNKTSVKSESNIKEKYNIYIVYSPTCPHCENLLNFLDREGIEIEKIPVEKFYVMKISNNLSAYFKGVPFVFAKVNNTILIISGYPSSNQERDGYFLGKDYEEKLCKEMNGTPVYINSTYAFCKIAENNKYSIFYGNRYSILWLIEQCKEYGCEKLE